MMLFTVWYWVGMAGTVVMRSLRSLRFWEVMVVVVGSSVGTGFCDRLVVSNSSILSSKEIQTNHFPIL